jgi:hypothetical protein
MTVCLVICFLDLWAKFHRRDWEAKEGAMRKNILLIIGVVLLLQLAWVPVSAAAPLECGGSGGGFWHTVRWGETLSGIGWQYGVSPYSICAANGLGNCNYIYAGQRLWIPSGGGYYPCPGCSTYHTVSWGQTLSGIGAWYGVSAWSIASANNIYNLNHIYAGQSLCIP